MNAHVERWGDKLAICIPASLAVATGLSENTSVELSIEGGKLIIATKARTPSLQELLDRVTPENIHGEWVTGTAMGDEAW